MITIDTVEELLAQLITIEDAATEVFELSSSKPDGQDLGILQPKSTVIGVSIGRYDLEIVQSPTLLQSSRSEGTTGAVLWRSSLVFARWLQESTNVFFTSGLLRSGQTVLELGAGSAGLISTMLASRLGKGGKVIASDMSHITKLLQQNVSTNVNKLTSSRSRKSSTTQGHNMASIDVVNLDWEHDDASSLLRSCGLNNGVDVVVACDCIYNYALIKPFLETCKDVCQARQIDSSTNASFTSCTYCMVVQQLRQPEVLEEWLELALADFNVWRVPDIMLTKELSTTQGYVVHLMTLK